MTKQRSWHLRTQHGPHIIELRGDDGWACVATVHNPTDRALVAAAPDLLAALQLACEVLRAKGEVGVASVCESAIAKATTQP